MSRISLALLLSASCWCVASFANNIPMVGLDKDGAPVETLVPATKYRQNLKTAIVGLQTSTLPVLQKKSQKGSGWMLRSAVVGLGVNMELGLGEIKFGILPRFRVGFSNAKEPSMP